MGDVEAKDRDISFQIKIKIPVQKYQTGLPRILVDQ